MKHVKKGQESLSTMQVRVPDKMTIDGQVYICFKDVLYNLILNNLKQVDYSTINKKIHNITTQKLSAKHRRRIERQLKKNAGLR